MSATRRVRTRRRLHHCYLELAFALLATVFGTTARARPAGERVVVVDGATAETSWPEAAQRTRAELEAAGLEVVVAPAAPAAELERLARDYRAVAAIQIEQPTNAPQRRVVVQVVDRETGRGTRRTLERDGTADPARAAIQASELLYASLLEVEARSAHRGEIAPARPATSDARSQLDGARKPASWAFRAGTVALFAPGGIGPLFGAELGGTRYVLGWTGVSATAFAMIPSRVREGTSSASFVLGGASVGAIVEPWPLERASLALELRGGVLVATADGTSNSGAPTQLDVGTTGFVATSLILASYLRRDLRLRGALTGGASPSRMMVRFAGEPVATFGSLFFGVSLGVEWVD